MKKLLLSTILVLTTASVALANHGSQATFISDGGQGIRVSINGRWVNAYPQHEVFVTELSGGHQRVLIEYQGHRGRRDTYQTRIRVPAQHHGTYLVGFQRGYGISMEQVAIMPIRNGRPGYGPGRPGGHHGWIMSQHEVRRLVRALQVQDFDRRRVAMARQALSGNQQILSEDLREVLYTFDFESNRLDIAKLAYGQVADPQNFFLVYDAFTFDSSIRELERAMGGACGPGYGPNRPGRGNGYGNGHGNGPGRGRGGRNGNGNAYGHNSGYYPGGYGSSYYNGSVFRGSPNYEPASEQELTEEEEGDDNEE